MGYTHYWNQSENFTMPAWNAMVEAFNEIRETSGIPIDWDDETDDNIFFNGVDDDGHETFIIHRTVNSDFLFCKTARKPYDAIVVAMLIIASDLNDGFNWSSDGEDEDHIEGVELVSKYLST